MDNGIRNKKTVRLILMFIIIMCATITTGITLAKYISQTNSSDSGRVAKYAFHFDGDITTLQLGTISPVNNPAMGYINSETRNFTTSNKSIAGDICEVALKMTIKITTTNNLPIKIKLLSDNGTPTNLTDDEEITTLAPYGDGISKTLEKVYYFEASVEKTLGFVVTFVWAFSDGESSINVEDYIYANEVDLINVEIIWEQIK